MDKLYLCRDCGHVQEGPNGVPCGDNDYLDVCANCEAVESLDCYVKSFRPKETQNLKTWADRLAWRRAKE